MSSYMEVVTTFHGIQISKRKGIANLAIKGDSHNITWCLKEKITPCWFVQDIISKSCQYIMNIGNCKFSHMFREGNRVADAIANIGAFLARIKIWESI